MMWENEVQPGRRHVNIIRRMRFACSITKATDTYLEHVIPFTFLLQPSLRYTYIACIVASVYIRRK